MGISGIVCSSLKLNTVSVLPPTKPHVSCLEVLLEHFLTQLVGPLS